MAVYGLERWPIARGRPMTTGAMRVWIEQRWPIGLHEVMEAAARKLTRHGWVQKQVQDERGHVCAIGAVQAAVIGERYNVAPEVDWVVPFAVPGGDIKTGLEMRLRDPVHDRAQEIADLAVRHLAEVIASEDGADPRVVREAAASSSMAQQVVAAYNDMPGRSVHEVMRMLALAADIARDGAREAEYLAWRRAEAKEQMFRKARREQEAAMERARAQQAAEAAADAVIVEVLAEQPRPLPVPLPERERVRA